MDTLINRNVDFELRYGHEEGHTDLAFDEEGKAIITGGSDGEARYWILDDEEQDSESFPVGTKIFAVAVKGNKYYVASDSNDLKVYSLPEGSYEGTATRFTSSINHLQVSCDGRYIAAGAGDFSVKLVDLEDSSQKTFSGHEAPVLSVSIDPKNEFLVSSSCDATVRVWSISDQKCVRTFPGKFAKSNDFCNSSTLCRISWESNGDSLAVPQSDDICIYQRNTWIPFRTLKHKGFTGISICAYSPNGPFLAASNNEGIVLIWNLDKSLSSPIAIFVHEDKTPITCLKWNPKVEKQLALSDEKGKFSIVSISTPDIDLEDKEAELSQPQIDDLFGCIDDDDDFTEEAFLTEAEAKKQTNKPNELPKITFEPNKRKETDINSKPVEKKESAKDEGDELDDDDDDCIDLGALKKRYKPKIFGDDDEDEIDVNDVEDQRSVCSERRPKEKSKEAKRAPDSVVQPPFQVGSTPAHFQQRFMVWNTTGIVRCYNTSEEHSVDVEFHDNTLHHSINFTNTHNYMMADLSPEALLLSNGRGTDETSSRLVCMLFSTWDANKEWKYDMPEDEFVDCITLGNGFAAVATDQRHIRIFTVGGIQTHIFSVPGPVLCLAAQEQSLMIVYHNGSSLPGEQSLSMYILKVDLKSSVLRKQPTPNPVPIALSPRCLLSWAGFTDEGTPCSVDFNGMVRLYKDFIGNTWVPVANLEQNLKNKSDHYFIIGMSEIQQQIRCILCKGARYPPTIPRPNVHVLPFEIPLCEPSTARAKLEEVHLRNKLSSSLLEKLLKDGFEVEFQLEENYKKMSEALIKMFAMAVSADCDSLAIEVANLLPNQRAVEGAMRYAAQKRRTGLVQKLSEIAEEKLEELNQVESNDEPQGQYEPSPSRQSTVFVIKSSEDIALKPKALKLNRGDGSDELQTQQSLNLSSDEEETDPTPAPKPTIKETSDDDSVSLRPKPVKLSTTKTANPFKCNAKPKPEKPRQRRDEKQIESDSEPEMIEMTTAFDVYFLEMKEVIQEDFPEIESESLLRKKGKELYNDLEREEKKDWERQAADSSKRKQRKGNESSKSAKRQKSSHISEKLSKFKCK